MIDTERSKFKQLLSNYFSLEGLGTIFTIICLIGFFSGLVSSQLLGNEFRSNCKIPLETATEASSISIALEQLAVVKASCLPYINEQKQNFWLHNLEQLEKILTDVSPTTTTQERYFVLKHYRETIAQASQSIHNLGI